MITDTEHFHCLNEQNYNSQKKKKSRLYSIKKLKSYLLQFVENAVTAARSLIYNS